MPTGSEIVALLALLSLVIVAVTAIRLVMPFLVNAVIGLATLLVAEVYLGLEVAVTLVTLAIVAVGGLPGAVVVLLLSASGVAFVT
ncbi:pro-sigmaK processing inhibitor BofA family protein [Natrialbaceae archaeon A-gly3]